LANLHTHDERQPNVVAQTGLDTKASATGLLPNQLAIEPQRRLT
jgi:hypothetical protein